MWKINPKTKQVTMDLGDFGVILPMTISNISEGDIVKFDIYKNNKEVILSKNLIYNEEKWNLELTKDDSDKLTKDEYLYSIKQYRDDILQNTINKDTQFVVE